MTDDQDIEVRLHPEQWTTLANMLARAAAVSDRNKTAAEQARDKLQASKMREAVQKCRNSGCAMSAPLAKWKSLLTTGERLAKYSTEWSALAAITSAVGKSQQQQLEHEHV